MRAIEEARTAAGLSQRALSRALKEHDTYIYEIEAGQHGVRVEELIAIAEAIGIDPEDLFRRVVRR